MEITNPYPLNEIHMVNQFSYNWAPTYCYEYDLSKYPYNNQVISYP